MLARLTRVVRPVDRDADGSRQARIVDRVESASAAEHIRARCRRQSVSLPPIPKKSRCRGRHAEGSSRYLSPMTVSFQEPPRRFSIPRAEVVVALRTRRPDREPGREVAVVGRVRSKAAAVQEIGSGPPRRSSSPFSPFSVSTPAPAADQRVVEVAAGEAVIAGAAVGSRSGPELLATNVSFPVPPFAILDRREDVVMLVRLAVVRRRVDRHGDGVRCRPE